MAIERRELGIENNPDISVSDKSIEVIPEPSRQDLIRDAAQILVRDEEILIDDEIDAPQAPSAIPFDANLVDLIDESELRSLSNDLLSSIRSDKESRAEWQKTYVEGLKYLGMAADEGRSEPFEGSSGVIHPILAEAVTQFQAQAYKEMLPAKGPVKTQLIGQRTAETEAQADRVQEFMNFYIMNVMNDYDPELDVA
jgi:hypothetical protein